MKFKLEIDLENDAAQSPSDVLAMLRDVEARLDDLGDDWGRLGGGDIRDANGNRVGYWRRTR